MPQFTLTIMYSPEGQDAPEVTVSSTGDGDIDQWLLTFRDALLKANIISPAGLFTIHP